MHIFTKKRTFLFLLYFLCSQLLFHFHMRYYMHGWARLKQKRKNKKSIRKPWQKVIIFYDITAALKEQVKKNFFVCSPSFFFDSSCQRIIQCKHMYAKWSTKARKWWKNFERKLSLFMTVNSSFYSLPYNHDVLSCSNNLYLKCLLRSLVWYCSTSKASKKQQQETGCFLTACKSHLLFISTMPVKK